MESCGFSYKNREWCVPQLYKIRNVEVSELKLLLTLYKKIEFLFNLFQQKQKLIKMPTFGES